MTSDNEAPRTGADRGRRRLHQLITAAALVVSAVAVLLVALTLTTNSYVLPSPRPGGISPKHTAVWAPGVVAAVVAALAVLGSVGWLILNCITRPPSRLRWLISGLVLLAGVWTFATATLDRPNF